MRSNFCVNFLAVIVLGYTFATAQPESQLDSLKNEWLKVYNDIELNAVTSHYADGAGILYEDEFFQNKDDIFRVIKDVNKTHPQIKGFETIRYFEHSPNNYLEIGQYITEKAGDILAYIIAWKNNSGKWQRELEVIYTDLNPNSTDYTEIDNARQKWVDVANTNNPAELVKQLYSDDAYYFSHLTLSSGQTGISERYSFMENPAWKMKSLTAYITKQVQEDLVFEIGKWEMEGYGGLYTLIWKKNDGEWKVLLDFNF